MRGLFVDAPAQHPQISIHDNVTVGYLHGTFDRGADDSHFCGKRKGHRRPLPASMFDRYFYRKRSGLLKQVVPGTVDGLNNLFLGTVMGYGDSHSSSLTSTIQKYIACRTDLAY